jgi:plastocyanin
MRTLLFTMKTTPIVITTVVASLLLSSANILTPPATAQNISTSSSPPSSSSLPTTTPVQNTKVDNNNNASSSFNTTTTSASAPSAITSSNKSFYIFTGETEGVNETKLGIPPDRFSPNIFAVNEGDTVTIHFYNLDSDERHTFTIGAPYNINKDLAGGQNATFTFRAGDEGAYTFYCTYHQPTMTGELIVLPPPIVEKATPVNTVAAK